MSSYRLYKISYISWNTYRLLIWKMSYYIFEIYVGQENNLLFSILFSITWNVINDTGTYRYKYVELHREIRDRLIIVRYGICLFTIKSGYALSYTITITYWQKYRKPFHIQTTSASLPNCFPSLPNCSHNMISIDSANLKVDVIVYKHYVWQCQWSQFTTYRLASYVYVSMILRVWRISL